MTAAVSSLAWRGCPGLVPGLVSGLVSGVLAVMALCAAGAAPAAKAQCELEAGERVRIDGVIDGDTVELSDGREVRLVGIQAPKLPLGRRGFQTWPLAPEAKSVLEEMALARTAELRYGGTRTDRHGRVLAHLFVDPPDGGAPVWAQGAMLAGGHARVYSFPDNRSCVGELLERERTARAAGRGIWADSYYDIADAADEPGLEALAGTFQIVEGRVEDVAFVGGRVYLNFGTNYRQDFTLTIDPGDRRRFDGGGETLTDLTGRRIRVRGWIAVINGPMIELTHPEQIERLDDPAHGD